MWNEMSARSNAPVGPSVEFVVDALIGPPLTRSCHHVITRSDEAAVFLIETLARWAGEADPRDTEEALAWAAFNRPELWARWQQYSEEES